MRAAMRSTRPLCCVSVRVLRAYIYNALFTTAKPPKIRLSPLYFDRASLFHTCAPIPSVVLSLFLFLSRRHGFFYTSVAVDRHSIVPLRLTPYSFYPFYPEPFFAPPCSRINLALLFCSCNRYTGKRARWLRSEKDSFNVTFIPWLNSCVRYHFNITLFICKYKEKGRSILFECLTIYLFKRTFAGTL